MRGDRTKISRRIYAKEKKGGLNNPINKSQFYSQGLKSSQEMIGINNNSILLKWEKGKTLNEAIKNKGWLQKNKGVLVDALADAVFDHLCRRGTVHGDLHRNNIIVRKNKNKLNVKFIDYDGEDINEDFWKKQQTQINTLKKINLPSFSKEELEKASKSVVLLPHSKDYKQINILIDILPLNEQEKNALKKRFEKRFLKNARGL